MSKKYFLIKKENNSNVSIQNNNIFLDLKKNQKKMKNKNSQGPMKSKKKFSIRFYMIFIELLIIINLFVKSFLQNKNCLFSLQFSKITLKIKEKGNRCILGHDTFLNFNIKYFPDVIKINGDSQTQKKRCYDFVKENNYIEMIWNDEIDNCEFMFYACSDIIEINLSNFNSSLVKMMKYMFYGCSSLSVLNLTNFDTSNAEDMYNMFYGCSSLIYLNLINFNTSTIKDMSNMFYECSSLISLEISNFDTSLVTDMYYMFFKCSSLISLNVSNFNTSKVTSMHYMFYECSSLISLNLSSFVTNQVTWMQNMFYGCFNLQYINLKNFNENNLAKYDDIFEGVPNNIVVCIDENNIKDKILPELENKLCYVNNCSDNWKLNQKKIINEIDQCTTSCSNESRYKYEYNGKCYESCPNGFITDINNVNQCKCELEKCLLCPTLARSKGLCSQCNDDDGYYPMENDASNIGEFINCYKTLKGYYLDINEHLYKKCYYSCETCEIKGDNSNHNCLECNKNFSYNLSHNNYLNCYDDINEYKSNLINNEEHHTQEFEENENIEMYTEINSNLEINIITNEIQNYSKMIDIKELIKNILNNKTNETDINEFEEENKNKIYNFILNIFETIFTSINYDTSKLDNGEDDINTIDKLTITLTTSENQKNNTYNNMTTINLEQCETLLRDYYNLSENEKLYIKKIDVIQDKMKIPKVEFDIYSKLNGTNLIKLNISICEESKISLIVPVEINENIDILNSSSDYYHDICYKSTSERGTDMIINDRKIEFVESNKTICQVNCDISDYNYDGQKANCSCLIKESSSKYEDIIINRTKLYENFENSNKKEISNLALTKCNVLSSRENIKSNSGFYLLLFILVAFIIIFIIFYIKGYNLLERAIDEMIYRKFKNEAKNKEKKIENTNIKL